MKGMSVTEVENAVDGAQARQMVRAIWNDVVIAEGTDVVMLEGKYYFRVEDVRIGVLRPTSHTTLCPWKGRATYFDVTVGDRTSRNGGWVYLATSEAAAAIEGRVAFWRGVLIRRDDARADGTWWARLFGRRQRVAR